MTEADFELLKRVSILYIEDDETTRKNIAQLLERRAKKVYIARHGFLGVELFKEKMHAIDIIITDLRMPIMDGNDMLSRIKEQNPDVKVIVITAFPDDAKNRESIDAILSKPVDRDELFEAILGVIPAHFKD